MNTRNFGDLLKFLSNLYESADPKCFSDSETAQEIQPDEAILGPLNDEMKKLIMVGRAILDEHMLSRDAWEAKFDYNLDSIPDDIKGIMAREEELSDSLIGLIKDALGVVMRNVYSVRSEAMMHIRKGGILCYKIGDTPVDDPLETIH